MQASALVSQQIEHIDYEMVTDCGSDVRQRPLTVNAHDRSREHAIWIGSDPRDIEIICDGGSMSIQAQAEKNNTSKGKHVESDGESQQSREMWDPPKTSCTVCQPKTPSEANDRGNMALPCWLSCYLGI